jgi:hypothetical protein
VRETAKKTSISKIDSYSFNLSRKISRFMGYFGIDGIKFNNKKECV